MGLKDRFRIDELVKKGSNAIPRDKRGGIRVRKKDGKQVPHGYFLDGRGRFVQKPMRPIPFGENPIKGFDNTTKSLKFYFVETGIGIRNTNNFIPVDLNTAPQVIRFGFKQDDYYVLLQNGQSFIGRDKFTGAGGATKKIQFGAFNTSSNTVSPETIGKTLVDYIYQSASGLYLDEDSLIDNIYPTAEQTGTTPEYSPLFGLTEYEAAYVVSELATGNGTTSIKAQYKSSVDTEWTDYGSFVNITSVPNQQLLLSTIPTVGDGSDKLRFQIKQVSTDGSAEPPRIDRISIKSSSDQNRLMLEPTWGTIDGGNTIAVRLEPSDALKRERVVRSDVLHLFHFNSGSYDTDSATGTTATFAGAIHTLGVISIEFKEKVDDLGVSFIATATLAKSGYRETDILADKYGITADQAEKLSRKQLAVQAGLAGSEKELANFVTGLAQAQFIAGEELDPDLVALSKTLQEYRHEIERSAEQQEIMNQILRGQAPATEESREAIKKAAQDRKDLADTVEEHIRSLRDETTEILLGARAVERAQLTRKGYTSIQIEEIFRLQDLNAGLLQNRKELEKTAEVEKQKAEDKKTFIQSVIDQAKAVNKSSIELLREQASIHGVTTELEAAFTKLEEFKQAQDDAARQERVGGNVEAIRQSLMTEEELLLQSHQKKLADLDEAMTQEDTMIIDHQELRLKLIADYEKKKADIEKRNGKQEILRGAELTRSMLGQLGEQFAGVQAVNKKMFAAQKAYKIANAIQNTYDAANNALSSPYPWPLPQVFAATAVAAGLANVAAIKSTSFDGGGFTGMGARSGGVDGKGGFPAILHPNETVVDHTKGQSGGITVVNNIDASGADANVDMKIRAAVQQSSQQTIMSIQDLMRRRRFI